MKKEIPWELIISDLKQDISDADKKHLEEWVSIDENRKVYEELRGVWEKVRAFISQSSVIGVYGEGFEKLKVK